MKINIRNIINRKRWRGAVEDFHYFGLCQIFIFIAFIYHQSICAVGINDLSPELKKELEGTKLKGRVEDFLNKNSESQVEGFSKSFPISSEQSRDSEQFKNEYNGKDVKQLEGRGNAQMGSSENMKFLEKANGASSSVDRNDPAFSKYNNALKNNSASKDCMDIFGTSSSEVEGGKDLPEFLEVEKTRQIPRTTFNVKSCEDMKNKYSCTLTLKPKCIRPSKRILKFTNIRTNDGTSIGQYYDRTSVSNRRNHSSYDVSFDIEEGIEIDEFIITRINSNNALEIYFNDKRIYDGPSRFAYIKSGWFGAEHNSSIGEYANSYVRKKSNRLYFKATKFGSFWVDLSIRATVKVCQEWKDVWEEECTHQK
jgi:hypothetical protein